MHKYRSGCPFDSLDDLMSWLDEEAWVYWHGVPKHPEVIRHMQLGTVVVAVKSGFVVRAIEKSRGVVRRRSNG